MQKFDLEKAKAGAPLVTRDGKPVKHFYCSPDPTVNRPIIIWQDGRNPYSLQITGKQSGDFDGSLDLFLADPPKVKKSGWVNVYRIPHNSTLVIAKAAPNVFLTKVIADANTLKGRIACVEIHWEEEAV